MSTAPVSVPRLALLIDADNISAKYLPLIMNEVPRHGITTYRRIYGDFTDPQMATWRSKLLDFSIMPIQQFSNVKNRKNGESAGKNATDSTLIIDAMDILYTSEIDGFVIVSSDSDFTRLATRLRESNKIVIGMGRNQTAISFRHACTKFINIEYLYNLETGKAEPTAKNKLPENPDSDEVETTVTLKDVSKVVRSIIRNNDNKGRTTSLSEVGNSLSNKFPDFDVRNFGYSQLSKLIEELDRFTLIQTKVGYDVALADTADMVKNISQFVVQEVRTHKRDGIDISDLAALVYSQFPEFDLKDTGYSQFYKFVNNIEGITVVGTQHKRAVISQ